MDGLSTCVCRLVVNTLFYRVGCPFQRLINSSGRGGPRDRSMYVDDEPCGTVWTRVPSHYSRLQTEENGNELEGKGLEDFLFSIWLRSWVLSSDDIYQNPTFFNLLSIPPHCSHPPLSPPFILRARRCVIVALTVLVLSHCYLSLVSFPSANAFFLPFPRSYLPHSFPMPSRFVCPRIVDPSIPHAHVSPLMHMTTCHVSLLPSEGHRFPPTTTTPLPLPRPAVPVFRYSRCLGLRDDCIQSLNVKR